MTSPATDIARQRRRLIAMLAFNFACVLAAIAAAVGYLSFHVAWLGPVFILAMLAGFAAQIWLVAGLRAKP